MLGNILIRIRLTCGTEISYRKELSYDEYWSLAQSFDKSKDDELIVFQDNDNNEYLVPKKNILYISLGR